MVSFERRGLLLILLVFGISLTALTGNLSAQNWAEKMFKEKIHDFRMVGRGTKSVYHFDFTNLYEEDVHIAAVRTSCGCTTPTVSQKTLKTHEKASVQATFNTSSFVGQKSATVTVVFDRPAYAEVQLKVSGYIRTDITFDPPEINYGEISAGTSREQEVMITHRGNSDWEITDVRSHCRHLQVRLDPPQRSAGQVRYRMRVKLNESMDEGDIRERLTLISNDQEFPTTEMAIAGRIRPSVSVSPAAVSLGTTAPDSTISRRLVVRGDEPFEIMDVQCADKRFEFKVPVGEKKVHLMTVNFKGDGTTTSISQEIRIVTSLPDGKSASCVVSGTVSDGSK
ncbi:MAG: DUF1573 domain-containing protein [Rubripirellula sp.]|nr:DUF1573 domain-containing protein [Rubripirellula sp.]